MITDYIPKYEDILENLFNICIHPSIDEDNYCPDCKIHVTEEELDDMWDLFYSLSKDRGLNGGYYAERMLRFLSYYGTVKIDTAKEEGWHSFCWVIHVDENIHYHYYSQGRHSFVYNICWMTELAFRVLLLNNKYTKEELRRVLNG